ncbi:MAG: NAD-dependent epimerase [gamma proteobacterium symbiont of Lucinoma myriamae]|nr:NAD-dependent epimerase [gamma proteobacterium symbiont of Lucinoma myriamae]MCU7817298.1 NAD-dependent epimerase [gamma proteobacterium symbiont of Lucinoma myriamae]MCU7832052.1 NAD-dependent epimerase [gamma proteobacterium symbiont of Lucinoma myriamae]
MKILVTGAAGFIGSKLSEELLARGDDVVGIDILNDYYDVRLKKARLKRIEDTFSTIESTKKGSFRFIKMDLADRDKMESLFAEEQFEKVVNLAAQAGVRYSIENPLSYIDSNIVGFAHILEGCRHNKVKHLVYASSSSVYGLNESMPFSIHDNVDHPISLYAASKKSGELMAHTYSHLYQLPTTGLRFFTVYGPWDRPDMALQKFAKAIYEGKAIDVYNYGKHRRDFTYIDDIVEGIIRVLDNVAQPNPEWSGQSPDSATSPAPWRIYNIGNQQPVELMTYIETLEKHLGKTAEKNLLPLQPGDVPDTYADVTELVKDVDYKPSTTVDKGIKAFASWYKDYYNVKKR